MYFIPILKNYFKVIKTDIWHLNNSIDIFLKKGNLGGGQLKNKDSTFQIFSCVRTFS